MFLPPPHQSVIFLRRPLHELPWSNCPQLFVLLRVLSVEAFPESFWSSIGQYLTIILPDSLKVQPILTDALQQRIILLLRPNKTGKLDPDHPNGGHKEDMSCCRPKGIFSMFEMAEMRNEWLEKQKLKEKEKEEKSKKKEEEEEEE